LAQKNQPIKNHLLHYLTFLILFILLRNVTNFFMIFSIFSTVWDVNKSDLDSAFTCVVIVVRLCTNWPIMSE